MDDHNNISGAVQRDRSAASRVKSRDLFNAHGGIYSVHVFLA